MTGKIKKYLPETHPHLLEQWDWEKNEISPDEVTYGSHKKVWWRCKEESCKEGWRVSVNNKTSSKIRLGCPFCYGRHVSDRNRLFKVFPNLEQEWDITKNGSLHPDNVSYGSHKKVWWKCKRCRCSWRTRANDRTSGSFNGCPACSNKVVTETNNLKYKYPDLVKDWNSERNIIGPTEVVPGSNKKVWWKCRKSGCRYEWCTVVISRTKKRPTGCPACSGQVVTDKNRLSIIKPDLLLEWDYSKNTILPRKVSFSTTRAVWWICKDCEYGWEAQVSNRSNDSGCPSCSNRVVTKDNNLVAMFLEISKEWDQVKNKGLKPNKVVSGSHKKAWWRCKTCGNSWKCCIKDRTNKGSSCPKCSGGAVSKVSQKWLDNLDIKIREYYIKSLGFRVDGFDPKTHTVYEFLGDYWHGNPEKYSAEEINPTNKKSFGKLYQETQDRVKLLEKAGYNVVYIWENDFNREVNNGNVSTKHR